MRERFALPTYRFGIPRRELAVPPAVFEAASYPERIELQGRAYAYVGAQGATPVYRHECEIDPALREKS
jgi:hypothetical protein